jgi:sugar lactone lactonase YvrE
MRKGIATVVSGSSIAVSGCATLLWLVSPPALVGQEPAEERIRPGDIVVANLGDHSVSVFDGESGAFRGPAFAPGTGGLQNATGIAFGPDGALYVGSSGNGRILRYDGATGAFIDVFASGDPLERPFSLIFGPGGDLFVSSGPTVLRYRADGSFVGYAARDPTLEQPIGLATGPDGSLYVVSSTAPSIVRFDFDTGASAGAFVTDSLAFPSDVAFGPDGDLYVSNASASRVVRFDGSSGAFEAVVATLPERGVPMGLAFRGRRLVIGDFARGRLYFVDIDDPGAGPMEVARQGLLRPENVAVRPGPGNS